MYLLVLNSEGFWPTESQVSVVSQLFSPSLFDERLFPTAPMVLLGHCRHPENLLKIIEEIVQLSPLVTPVHLNNIDLQAVSISDSRYFEQQNSVFKRAPKGRETIKLRVCPGIFTETILQLIILFV